MTDLFTSPFMFISYAHADDKLVTRLKSDLQAQGINTWIDQEGIQPGTPDWEEAIRTAIRAADAVLLIASPNARSSRHVKDELRIAEMYQLPVYPIWIAGTQWIDAVPIGLGGMQYIDAREASYEIALNRIVMVYRKLLSEAPNSNSQEAEMDFKPRNPYKGLSAFTGEDARDFFGRDQLIHEFAQALQESLNGEKKSNQSARLLTVIGPSGSGKSSMVMAGLLPCLQVGKLLPGSEKWVYLEPIVPGVHPVQSLTFALVKKLGSEKLKMIREVLEDDSSLGLSALASTLAGQEETRVVLFVDQFEELFNPTASESERQRFIDLLVTAITQLNGPVIVILTLRADFYDRPMLYPELGKLIQEHHKSVLPMEVRDLRAVIEEPAKLDDVKLNFEDDLAGDLLFEVKGQNNALPLLQFTLDQLFQKRDNHLLTLDAYHELGGVKGALAKHAESIYASLPTDEHRQLARVLFLRLIDPGMTEQDTTRRRAPLRELTLSNPAQAAILQKSIDDFVAARLITTNTVVGIATLEVSHEALIQEWKRLADWLITNRSDLLLQKAISEDAAEWMQLDKPVDRLYQGSRLVEAQAWAERNKQSINIDEEAFLQESVAERERQDAAERVRQARELELQRFAARRLRYVIGLMGLIGVGLVVVLVVTLVLFATQRNLLTAQRNLLTAQNSLLNSLPVGVRNLNDHGPGSLRDAIKNAHSGAVITFARNLGGTIRLTSGDISITTDVAIIGPGASVLAISGEHKSRVFTVNSNLNVAISNLTVKDGDITHKSNASFEASGGGIYTELLSALTLTNVVITGNAADFGGGIYNHTGNVTITNSTISNNTARGDGGGIESKGTLTITKSTISNNTAAQDAGGIDNQAGLFLTNSTISGNTAAGDVATTGYGGGILNMYSANVIYTTLYGNKAVAGGGIANTIANQPENGIGVFLETSIVAGDTATSGPDILGAATLYYLSLIQNTSGADFSSGPIPPESKGIFELGTHSLLGESPRLAPLQSNGGPTQTNALLPGSPAIDQMKRDASDQICGPNSLFPTDQRGVARPQGTGCDLGAYEYMPPQ